MRILLAAATSLIALAGCVDGNNYDATAKQVRVETDKFTGITTTAAPWTGLAGQERLLMQGGKIFAEAWITRDTTLYGGWLFADRAYVLGDTAARQVVRTGSNVDCGLGGCYTKEAFRVDLKRQDLVRGASSGLEISLRGKGGSTTVKYPAPYVKAFLDALTK